MIKIAVAASAVVMLAGCATATRGSNTAWEVNTIPSGAEVVTSHGHHCAATPCAMTMPRKSQFVATITLDGYEPATVTVTNRVGTGGGVGMAGNVLLGGVIGAGVDMATGAMLDLVPNPVTITLRAIGSAAAAVIESATPEPAAPATPPSETAD